MKIFSSNKGIISTHPVYMFALGVIVGVIIAVLWAKQYIAVPFPFCK